VGGIPPEGLRDVGSALISKEEPPVNWNKRRRPAAGLANPFVPSYTQYLMW